jgi:phosphatidylglycerophosphate synthase
MQLHRAAGNDWDAVAIAKQNNWQKLARRTNGLVSPGNFITVLGCLLVVTGLVLLLHHKSTWLAVILLMVGRLADLADGLVADWTGTKSPVGEAMDAIIDKIELALVVIVIWLLSLLPTAVFIVFAVHTVSNVVLSTFANYKTERLHPSRSGKLAAAGEWAVIALFVLHYGLSLYGFWNNLTALVAWGLFAGSALLAIFGSYQYSRQLTSSHGEK